MKPSSKYWAVALIALVGFAIISAPGEEKQRLSDDDLRIRDIETDEIRTPDFDVSVNLNLPRTSSEKRWYQILVEYDTEPEWIDQIDIDLYALLEDSDQKGREKYKLLKTRISYINLEKGRHVATAYIHPSTLERFGDVERVAVMVSSQGQVLGVESDPSSRIRWWEQLSPTEGLILNRLQTPYAWIYSDSYDAIKQTK